IVLLVFWPVLYTDVTDGWKLYSRHRRLAISLAGIAAELVIAGLATFAWTVSEPGVWQSVFFVIASSTWLSTLAVNLNPAMRFDGYYILGDIWGIENLQQRAFAVTRWKLHQLFLGINVRPPEEGLTKQRITGMAVYSIYTWIYRVFLYVAIALLVYYKFAKIIGILLFALEIALFFVWPIVSEAQILYALRSQIHWNPRTLATSTAIALFVAWSLLPLPQRVEYQAVVVPLEEQLILVPRSSTVAEIFVKRGDHVNIGDPILRLQDPKLDTDITVTQLDVDALKWQIEQGNIDASSQPYIAEKRSELQSTRARLASLLAVRETLLVRATVSGVLHEWYDSIRPGIALTHKSELGRIADSSQVKAIAFVPEKDLERYRLYSNSSFRVRSPIQTVDGELRPLRFVRSQTLEYIALASTYHGNLPVSERNDGTLELVESF
ncbi:MAG: biotin/lipoyl-binding protein, partial [Chlamydiia bacterium]|nr:biotin/lipoyl-binding protein [Chlamydiia bacterium]